MAKHEGKKMPNTSKPHKSAGNANPSGKRDHRQQPSAQTTKPSVPPVPWPAPKLPERRGEYRFLNPYNFVRYLPEPVIPFNDPDAQLLGRCAPPPHDRY
ncbi:MAG: TIGR03986 family CRISPR-associated RAMP protein, partial [Roseiflexus sp.]|nr:TIGR03986 family CRISPR-associated RAMP protein [Roseiflexus sp.]